MKRTALKRSTKRMRQTRSTDKPTAKHLDRWARMKAIGCVACLLGRQIHGQPIVPDFPGTHCAGTKEIHHLTSCGRRRGHDMAICLCRYHHQGDFLPFDTHGYQEQAQIFGPSYGREARTFRAHYGPDDALHAFQCALLLRQAGK
jgi:hypothetical protein